MENRAEVLWPVLGAGLALRWPQPRDWSDGACLRMGNLMATVLLFHHALGLTDGVLRFAGSLEDAGHVVHCPDLYDGKRFESLDEGVAHAEQIGFERIMMAGVRLADTLPGGLVYAGFSLGVLPAQKLAQTRPGSRGALLYHDVIPGEYLDSVWPSALPLQIHVTDADPWADHEAIRNLAGEAEDCDLFLYPGNAHLFADDTDAATLLLMRSIAFLNRI